jgi:hypothetical protein
MEKAKSGNSLQKAAAAAAILVVLGMLAWRYNMPLSELEERAPRDRHPQGLADFHLFLCGDQRPADSGARSVQAGRRDAFRLRQHRGDVGRRDACGGRVFLGARLGGYDLVRWLFGKRLLAMNDRLQKATWRSIFIIRIIR